MRKVLLIALLGVAMLACHDKSQEERIKISPLAAVGPAVIQLGVS